MYGISRRPTLKKGCFSRQDIEQSQQNFHLPICANPSIGHFKNTG
ncbi:hypothetical protein SAMN05660816_05740 [Niastella yeongjuensis]|nr:hypothetical protein SAMN05660816_05740 [Niastella yeongjuensis]